MKVSELIRRLKEERDKVGDVDVLLYAKAKHEEIEASVEAVGSCNDWSDGEYIIIE